MTACLQVIYRAVLEARVIAWSNERLSQRIRKKNSEQIADLMDAIHNIPLFLNNWEQWDKKTFLHILACYDEKWGKNGINLTNIWYEEINKNHRVNING